MDLNKGKGANWALNYLVKDTTHFSDLSSIFFLQCKKNKINKNKDKKQF